MKRKNLIWTVAIIAVIITFGACDPIEPGFDRTLLIGKWRRPSQVENAPQDTYEYYRYDATYSDYKLHLKDTTVKVNGATWDTGDDVTEAEAQPFVWTLEKARLTQIHIMEVGGNIPKTYTIRTLTDSTLVCDDDFGTRKSFVKVKN